MNHSDILKKVRRIELRTRHVVNTVLSGEYHSAFKGQGIEFAEVREYLPGDDVRTIDWNVTARMGHPYVKIFDEERELTVMLLVDASSSGDFGSVEQTKNEIAVELSALLAFSAIKNNDQVGMILFTDKIEEFIPPKKGRKHVLRVIRELLARFEGLGSEAQERARRPHPILGALGGIISLVTAAGVIATMGAPVTAQQWSIAGAVTLAGLLLAGLSARFGFRRPEPLKGRGTDIEMALDFLNSVTTRRGIVFIISDFQAEGFENALSIAKKRHDVVAISITDPREVSLVGAGLLTLEDPETGEQVVINSSDGSFREAFHELYDDASARRTRVFRRTGVDAIDIWTNESYVEPLVRFFTARANRL